MKAPIHPQPLDKLPIRQQRLTQHLSQVNSIRIVVPCARHLDRNLDPRSLALALLLLTSSLLVVRARRSLNQLRLAQRIARGVPRPRLLHLGLDADNRLGAVCEADARAAVGPREDVGLGAERAELGCCAAVRAEGRGQGEGGVEVGEFGGGEEGGVGGGHGLLCWRGLEFGR